VKKSAVLGTARSELISWSGGDTVTGTASIVTYGFGPAGWIIWGAGVEEMITGVIAGVGIGVTGSGSGVATVFGNIVGDAVVIPEPCPVSTIRGPTVYIVQRSMMKKRIPKPVRKLSI